MHLDDSLKLRNFFICGGDFQLPKQRLRGGDQAGISTRFCPDLGLGLESPRPGLLLNSESSQNLSFQDQFQNGFAWSPVSGSLGMLFTSS